MKRLLTTFLLPYCLLVVVPQAVLADAKPGSANEPDQFTQVRSDIEAGKWSEASAELARINATASADWNNLMGYLQRKKASPDLAAAERYYHEALRIDPAHRGALEYSGELYLMKGDLAAAEQRLATLDKVCFFGCEQYTDLKQAIARYKAAGNRYVAPK